MTRDQLVQSLIAYAGDDFDESDAKQRVFLEATVDDAIEEVCNEMHPYGAPCKDAREHIQNIALAKYGFLIRRIAMFHYDKQGKAGVTTFYEAGQTTTYSGGGTPREYLDGIVPIAKVV